MSHNQESHGCTAVDLGALEGREAGKGQQNPFPLRKSKKKASWFLFIMCNQLIHAS